MASGFALPVEYLDAKRDFLAVGDGSTDDTSAFSDFNTALGSTGAGVIPAGTYSLTSLPAFASTALLVIDPGAILLLNGVPQNRLSYYHPQGTAYNLLRETFASGSSTTTTGSMASGSTSLTSVASTTGWDVGMGISVAGAGASGALLVSQVTAISGSTFTLADSAGTAVTAATVSHEDSTAVQAWVTACAGHKGFAPAGIYNVQNIIIPSYVDLEGAGPDNTVFTLTAGSTDDVFITKDFASLTGTNSNGGVAGVRLANFKIDGNKANASSGGWCLQRYGYRWSWENVELESGEAGNLYSEWGTATGSGADGGFMEDHITNLRVHDSAAVGIQWRGPHDSRAAEVLTYYNGGVGLSVEQSSEYTGGGLILSTFHAYTNGSHGLVCNSEVIGDNVQSESQKAGDGIQILVNNCQLTNILTFSNPGSGVTLGASGSTVSGCLVQGICRGNASAQIALAGDGGDNIIDLVTYNGTGQPTITGSADTGTFLRIIGSGSGALSFSQSATIGSVSLSSTQTTTSTSYVSAGVGAANTPASTQLRVHGVIIATNNTAGDGFYIAIYRTTGSVPTTGSAPGASDVQVWAANATVATASNSHAFSFDFVDANLTASTTYSYYPVMSAKAGGTASMLGGNNDTSVVVEQA